MLIPNIVVCRTSHGSTIIYIDVFGSFSILCLSDKYVLFKVDK